MKVEKLVGYKPYSTFSEVKNAQINGGFTHRITYSYTDFTPTDALTATVNANLFKNAAGASKGLLDGMQVGHVAMYVKAAFSGIANQTSGANGAKFNFGPTGNTDAFIDDKGVHNAGDWLSFAPSGDTTSFGYIADADKILGGKLTVAVDSGSEDLVNLTAGELVILMEIINLNDLLAEGAFQDVNL